MTPTGVVGALVATEFTETLRTHVVANVTCSSPGDANLTLASRFFLVFFLCFFFLFLFTACASFLSYFLKLSPCFSQLEPFVHLSPFLPFHRADFHRNRAVTIILSFQMTHQRHSKSSVRCRCGIGGICTLQSWSMDKTRAFWLLLRPGSQGRWQR